MKSLSLAKPLIIVTVGLPGSGKSFFARQFSETFGAPAVSYDRLCHELFAEPTHSKDERAIITRVAEYQIEELMKTKKTFIIDGGGNSKIERVRLKRTAEKNGYETLAVWSQVDERTAKQRSMRRSKRRKGDEFNKSLTEEQYQKAARRFTPPAHNEDCVVISGKHVAAAQAKAVLKKLVVPRDEINPHQTDKPLAPKRQMVRSPLRRNVKIR